MKTVKALAKRVRITPRGKVLARAAGQNHFRSRVSGTKKLALKRPLPLRIKKKTLSRFLPYHLNLL